MTFVKYEGDAKYESVNDIGIFGHWAPRCWRHGFERTSLERWLLRGSPDVPASDIDNALVFYAIDC